MLGDPDLRRAILGITPASNEQAPLPLGPSLAIGPTEDLPTAIRRMALEQMGVIQRGFDLEEDDTILDHTIHQARKAGKRLRGLLRLCRYELGGERYRYANELVRDQARKLSEIRTTAVLQLTLDRLVEDAHLPVEPIKVLRDSLSERHAEGLRRLRADHAGRAAARAALDGLAEQIVHYPAPPEYHDQGLSALHPAIKRIYRQGRKAMRRAAQHDTAFAFHQWRKRVNYLRYQMEALRGQCAPPIDALAEALAELSETLGTDHDLAELLEAAGPLGVPTELGLVISTQSRELRTDALSRGAELFAETPAAFIRTFAEHSRTVA